MQSTLDDSSGFEEFSDGEGSYKTSHSARKAQPVPQERVPSSSHLNELPTCLPLVKLGDYSLEPDMLFGWRPKVTSQGGPIPLRFDHEELPIAENPMTETPYPVIYYGARPKDSIEMHLQITNEGTYPFPINPVMMANYNSLLKYANKRKPRPFVGMSPVVNSNELRFNSLFESGNLDTVVKIKEDEYDLYMRADANTRGHNQWYYFSVSNLKNIKTVRFHILNFTKNASLYSQGMQPNVYSKKRHAKGWHRAGSNIKYQLSKINTISESRKKYYSLSFDYTFDLSDDEVYFSYAVPYTYTHLTNLLKEFKTSVPHSICHKETLCKSMSGLDVPLITITNFTSKDKMKKDYVVIAARVHPGETPSSWVMEGVLRYLLSDNEVAVRLRDDCIFKIIPMLNPDGVVLGNYRTSLSGNDLNRQFQDPDYRLHPEIFSVKSLLYELKKNGTILTFIDLHAHSKKKSVFMYGPYYPLHSNSYFSMRVLPKILNDKCDMFRYYSCKFRSEKSKRKAARLVVWKEMRLCNSYTLETSFHGYITDDRATIPFNEDSFKRIGHNLADCLSEFKTMKDQETQEREIRRRNRLMKRMKKKKKYMSQDITSGIGNEGTEGKEEKTGTGGKKISDVIRAIKQVDEQKADESDSGGSDSEPSEDELKGEEQEELRKNILDAMEQFNGMSESARVRNLSDNIQVDRSKGKKIFYPTNKLDFDEKAKSSLAVFFSKALKNELREKKNRKKSESVNNCELKFGSITTDVLDYSALNICKLRNSSLQTPQHTKQSQGVSIAKKLKKYLDLKKAQNTDTSMNKSEKPPKHKSNTKILAANILAKSIQVSHFSQRFKRFKKPRCSSASNHKEDQLPQLNEKLTTRIESANIQRDRIALPLKPSSANSSAKKRKLRQASEKKLTNSAGSSRGRESSSHRLQKDESM